MSMVPAKLVLAIWILSLLLASSAVYGSTPAKLPVYIEDSHAGTFYWIVNHLPLDREYQLVLLDAHSDASEILHSDSLRREIIQAASSDQLESIVRRWRDHGVIQNFNWIEPLMPRPVSKVWWIPAESLTEEEIKQYKRIAGEQINAHEIAMPRDDGDFSMRYQVSDFPRITRTKLDGPVIASIDLDYFARLTDAGEIHSQVEHTLDWILGLRDLQAITFSISSLYLASDDQAHLLLEEILNYMDRIVNAEVQFEPYAVTGEDRSEAAKALYRQRRIVPRYDIEKASALLRSSILQNRKKIIVNEQNGQWQNLLGKWEKDNDLPRILLAAEGRRLQPAESYELEAEQSFRLQIENLTLSPEKQIRWKILAAPLEKYNLSDVDQGFAEGASRFLLLKEKTVDAASNLLDVKSALLLPFFDRRTGWGTIRIFAEVQNGRNIYVSNILRISRFRGDGYSGKLTEIFNLPYIYGSAKLRIDGKPGADSQYGADCSNFIIYGKRRSGVPNPYLNPKDLLPFLESVEDFVEFRNGVAYGRNGPIRINSALLKDGLLLHFGKHIAAIFDNGRAGEVLTEDTPVIHQLETYPEIIPFRVMAAKYRQIRIMKFK